jgi:hypothetical protein
VSALRPDCPLCGAAAPPPFLLRERVPVYQNLPLPSAEAARAVPRGTLAMAACESCGFVFNRAFDPALLRYGPGYDNTQSRSPRFAAHLDARARHLLTRRGVRGARIVEAGCGNGDFLRRLVAGPETGNRGTGYDPAYRGAACDLGGRLRFVRGLYHRQEADVLICRHVIEHLADPPALLAAIAAPRAFFETPCAGWILRHRVIWDFFYEHCALFTARSLSFAFARAGFAVRAVRHVFAGQYLWLEAEAGGPVAAAPRGPGRVPALARRYGQAEPALLALWRDRLGRLARDGKVALWGAGAKGATLAALADPDRDTIDCLVDVNPAKQGKFIPGSAHPIVAPADLAARGVRHVVPMNPAYRAEVAAMLPANGRAALVCWDG